MDIKKDVVLSIEIDNNKIELRCQEQTPLGALWDAVNQYRNFIFEKLREQQCAMESQQSEEKEAEETKADE